MLTVYWFGRGSFPIYGPFDSPGFFFFFFRPFVMCGLFLRERVLRIQGGGQRKKTWAGSSGIRVKYWRFAKFTT